MRTVGDKFPMRTTGDELTMSMSTVDYKLPVYMKIIVDLLSTV
jgi:hypothetical protein